MAKPKKKTGKKAAKGQPPKPKRPDKLNIILEQQAEILKNEQAIRKEESRIERLEQKEVVLEEQTLAEEKREDATQQQENAELAKLESLEKEIKHEVSQHPLTRLTTKDCMKGIVGAFIGVVVHFTFTYGVELAEGISAARATALLIFSFIVGAVFLYGTGFRKIKDRSVMWLLPYRLVVLYATAIIVTTATLWFFYPQFGTEAGLAFKQIATVNLSAVIGACTADLIGRD